MSISALIKKSIMNKLIITAMAGVVLLASSCSSKYASKTELKDNLDSVSYALGVLNGEQIGSQVSQQLPFNITDSTALIEMLVKYELNENFTNHFNNIFDGLNAEAYKYGFYHQGVLRKAQIDLTIADVMCNARFNDIKAKKDEERRATAAKALEEGKKFLEENAKKEGVTVLESGLQYQVITMGGGAKPTESDRVKVHYTGKLLNGEVFDSSVERGEPSVFGLRGVIKGWTEILQLMPVGSKWIVYIPSELAYGEYGGGDKIPGNSTLIFEIELLDINPEQNSAPSAK